MPFDLNNAKENLIELKFSGIKWLDTDYYSNQNTVVTFENVKLKFEKLFDEKDLKRIFTYFDLGKKNYLNQRETIRFNAYIFKKFPRMQQIPVNLFELTNFLIIFFIK